MQATTGKREYESVSTGSTDEKQGVNLATVTRASRRNWGKKLQRRIKKAKLEEQGTLSVDEEATPPLAIMKIMTNTFTLKFDELSTSQVIILSEAIYNELHKNDVSKKSLPPQSIQSIPIASLIPTEFVDLLESEVFNTMAEPTKATSFGL
ncbi:11085_t:CDS:2 [Acaulospora colombiana]|uniref:11085_t:CDS:1 n=1 Tax=Acaulospora colombiana TaxID=27376 RepID=A0ACA9LE98_9GLOM|nr:11085_t:CDS:2 [Acaulospora colombiana]